MKLSIPHFCIVVLALILLSCKAEQNNSIRLWYGQQQTFGTNGNPQRQINVLGNLENYQLGDTLYFVLNSEIEKRHLTLGSDSHRLALPGDFNIEIDRVDLVVGENQIRITHERQEKTIGEKEIIVNYLPAEKPWPLPYSIKWSEVKKIQDVVQVVDGQWQITDEGIKTKNKYYDRFFAVGDSTWKNLKVKTRVKLHSFTVPYKAPPSYNVSHFAIASLWPGHSVDGRQPSRQWYPLGATSEFRLEANHQNSRWRIFDGLYFYKEASKEEYRTIEPETWYSIIHQVEEVGDSIRYSVKLWRDDIPEPKTWDLIALEKKSYPETGSVCFLAHNTNVTFGDIYISPLY